jgi:hypothetical protein
MKFIVCSSVLAIAASVTFGGPAKAGHYAEGRRPASAGPVTDVEFADVTKAVGIAFTHANSATPSKYLIETMGGGVALLDYDNDGRLDVFFTNGAKLEDPMPRNRRPDSPTRRTGTVCIDNAPTARSRT